SMCVFFAQGSAPTAIYALSLHDALPISQGVSAKAEETSTSPSITATCCSLNTSASMAFRALLVAGVNSDSLIMARLPAASAVIRSEEHTSELQSRENLVCRLLLEKQTDT